MNKRSIILVAAGISGVSVFVNSLAVKAVPNSFFFTTAKNVVTAFLILSVIIFFSKIGEFKKLSKRDWSKLYFLGFIGGSIPFLLFFRGLSLSAVTTNGAFIQKTMFIWVAVLSFVFLKEKISHYQKIGLVAILGGIILMGGVKTQAFGLGELYILIATLLWSVEAMYVSKFAKHINVQILAFGRMFFGSLFMLSYILMTQKAAIFSVTKTQFNWIFVTSVFLVCYVLTYYQSLARFKASEVTAILTIAFPITVISQSIYSSKPINILPLLLISMGAVLYLASNKSIRLQWKG